MTEASPSKHFALLEHVPIGVEDMRIPMPAFVTL